MMETYFENEFAQFRIKDKILSVEFKDDVILDLPAAQNVTGARLSILEGRPYAVLYNITGIHDSNKCGRDYFVQHCQLFAKAIGVYAGGETSMIMARLYLRLKCPTIPCELFSNRDKAISFLDSHK